jgi:Mrp family chromosome partitioning ATPase
MSSTLGVAAAPSTLGTNEAPSPRFVQKSQWASYAEEMPERTALAWSGPREADDEPVDVPRYLAALKRAWPLIVLLIVLMTATVLLLSLALSESYRATARIVLDDRAGGLETTDVETMRRRLATVQALLTTRNVLEQAAERLPDETVETLGDKVEASVDEDANIIDIDATDGDPAGAAAIANALARSFLRMQETAERERLTRARTALQTALARLRGSPSRRDEAQVIRARLNELSLSEAGAGTELQLAQSARPPSEPDSPRPVRNTIFAFFASAFIAVLAALAIDQVAPRLSGPRELSRLTGVPILAALPPPRRLRVRRGQTEEAYQALEASALQLPADRKVMLITSPFTSEEKSTVAARLARSLARAGSRTLLISADIRRPRIEKLLGLPLAPGLTDVVGAIGERGGKGIDKLVGEAIAGVSSAPGDPDLDVLPSGSASANPAQLFAGEPMSLLFGALERSDYRYVLVDGSPLLGVIDGPLLAQYADAVIAVCRVDRMTPAAAAELGDVLRQLHAPALGLVAIGARGVVPYSLGLGPWTVKDARSRAEA